jgi:hypothetical protein
MAWSWNTEKDLRKLEKIIRLSEARNKHKANYNAAAVMLGRNIKSRVNNGTIQGNQKNRFRAMYNKFGPVINQRAMSQWAKKIVNDPNLMKRYFNGRNTTTAAPSFFSFLGPPPPRNANFQKKFGKLEAIVGLSRGFGKHKKNYNAAAVILLRQLKPQVNNGTIKGPQKNSFNTLYRKLIPIVNMSAVSPYAVKIVNNPYAMRQFFNRQNKAVPAPLPPLRPANTQPKPLNLRPRSVNSRLRPMNMRPRPLNTRPHGQACVVKRIGLFGQTVCK